MFWSPIVFSRKRRPLVKTSARVFGMAVAAATLVVLPTARASAAILLVSGNPFAVFPGSASFNVSFLADRAPPLPNVPVTIPPSSGNPPVFGPTNTDGNGFVQIVSPAYFPAGGYSAVISAQIDLNVVNSLTQ